MINRQTIPLLVSDSPGQTVLEILRMDLGINPSFGTIRSALQMLADYVTDEVIQQRPYTDESHSAR